MPDHRFLDDSIIHAAAVLADANTLISDGAVFLHNGRIADVGLWRDIRRRHPDAADWSAGGQLISPGLVNIHTHLELGYLRGKIPAPAKFPDWVCRLFELSPPPEQLEPTLTESVSAGIAECHRYGVTAIGDITRHAAITRRAAADMPMGGISFGEITATGKARGQLAARIRAAEVPAGLAAGMQIGLSPHAPYSVEGPALRQIVQHANAAHYPLAMHLAELPYEREFLRDFSGPLGRHWPLRKIIDVLDDEIPTFDGSPVTWAAHWGLLEANHPAILAHVNDANDTDIRVLAGHHQISVAMCPRTRHYFGHHLIAEHPCLKMLQAGIRVCIATDSLASTPDLNLLAEAACARQDLPSLPWATLFRMVTQWPAEAIQLNAGRLHSGLRADMSVFPVNSVPRSAQAAVAELIASHPPAAAVVMGSQLVSGTLYS
ncbi:MAG: amidohydrolase family protein [Phycisphaerae bacterium]